MHLIKSHVCRSALVICVALIAGCSSKPAVQVNADDAVRQHRQNGGLDLPPDLLDSSNATVADSVLEGQQARQTVLPEIENAQIVDRQGQSALLVSWDADATWLQIDAYWRSLGVDYQRFEPAAGVMETKWIESSASTFQRGQNRAVFTLQQLFNRVTGKGAIFDRYAVRLQREGEAQTLVYVSHNSTSRQLTNKANKKLADYEWVEGQQDIEKQQQILQRLRVIFSPSYKFTTLPAEQSTSGTSIFDKKTESKKSPKKLFD